MPGTCDRCRSAVQTSAEEEEDCPGGTEITAVKAGEGIRCYSAEMVSANVRECGRMYEEMMILMSMEGRIGKDLPPSNNYQGPKQWGNHPLTKCR